MSKWWVCLSLVGLLGACRATEGSATQAGAGAGALVVRPDVSLEQAPVCGVELPSCAEGLSCIAFTLEGVAQARCLDATKACDELLSCSGGASCVLLESYPLQLKCSEP
ncbi:MAG: hypothetical protein ABW123_02795 [Cystobacter sp.]